MPNLRWYSPVDRSATWGDIVILCHCEVVADHDVHAALAQGARTVSAVCKATGAGRDCGACVFSVKALICEHQASESGLLEVDGAAS